MLDEQLRLAEAQGEELKAASWERDGPGWLSRTPWIIAIGALSALMVIAFRQRSA